MKHVLKGVRVPIHSFKSFKQKKQSQSSPRIFSMGFALALTAGLALSACAPKVYVIDRQTLLEEEAAGKWPQFEKELLDKSKAPGPTAYSEVPVNSKRKRLYNVLNGEMQTSAAEQPASGGSAQ